MFMNKQLLSTEQVAEEIGIPVTTLRYWRGRNEGPRSFRVGRVVKYRQGDIEEWIEEQMEATGRGHAIPA